MSDKVFEVIFYEFEDKEVFQYKHRNDAPQNALSTAISVYREGCADPDLENIESVYMRKVEREYD